MATEPAEPKAAANGQAAEPEDPLKKAKKEAKAAEKAAKKAKAAAKAEASKAAASAPKPTNTKKQALAAEAEEKKNKAREDVRSATEAARATPKGQKKQMAGDEMSSYHPEYVEAAWYDWWEKQGFFKPSKEDNGKPPFVIVIPPPNVTGSLHLGHALTNAIQDTVVRWKRMSGYNVLWVPGTDHAGIATQTVVEKQLRQEQPPLTRHDLGRAKFLEKVFEWKETKGNRICDQLRRIGSSVDWDRLVFTMDAPRSAAVKEAFIRLHRDGLIYRDNRLVNWDCTLRTAVSEIEVDHEDIPGPTKLNVPGYQEQIEFGVLTSFAYPLAEGDQEIVVATTRPETMIGDTAVAVHPDDPKYTHFHGQHVRHPLDGRLIPIICDAELVDMNFGTGAVKITPAHDPNDFATGRRHNLESINILSDDGSINSVGGQFTGQPRFKARVTVVDWLKELGLFRGTAPNAMRLGMCSRSKDVIEPVLKPQWWVSCGSMAADARAAASDGRLRILPSDNEATWNRWLDNIRDWCISRQLWWGHRIPAYYVSRQQPENGEEMGQPGAPSERMDCWVVAQDEADARAQAEAKFPGQQFKLQQDEDVLDTWFSSGLFPFSVMGWPQQTSDLSRFFPGALLETGNDILFFWVARMVMLSLQLTGQIPFKHVYLHTMVRDAHGRKMSKSLGNVVDPIDVIQGITLQGLHDTLKGSNLDAREIERAQKGQQADFPNGIEECGTDALRFALVSYTSQGRDINLDIQRVVSYRHWCNKLWNAIKFGMLKLKGFEPGGAPTSLDGLPFACAWILDRLNLCTTTVIRSMESYDFSAAATALYDFWQYSLCDIFIELVKPITDERQEGLQHLRHHFQGTLYLCLEQGLRLLHPFMPFVTEELWQRLPRAPAQNSAEASPPSLMVAPYPEPVPAWADAKLHEQMKFLSSIVKGVGQLRTDYKLASSKRPQLSITCSDSARAELIAARSLELTTLALASSLQVLDAGAEAPTGCPVSLIDESTSVYMQLGEGDVDHGKELEKHLKEQEKQTERMQQLEKRLRQPDYADKTPSDVQQKDAEKLQKYQTELAAVIDQIAQSRKFLSS